MWQGNSTLFEYKNSLESILLGVWSCFRNVFYTLYDSSYSFEVVIILHKPVFYYCVSWQRCACLPNPSSLGFYQTGREQCPGLIHWEEALFSSLLVHDFWKAVGEQILAGSPTDHGCPCAEPFSSQLTVVYSRCSKLAAKTEGGDCT